MLSLSWFFSFQGCFAAKHLFPRETSQVAAFVRIFGDCCGGVGYIPNDTLLRLWKAVNTEWGTIKMASFFETGFEQRQAGEAQGGSDKPGRGRAPVHPSKHNISG